jgi:membrane fusion protein (multidrug efflux system)
MPDENAPMSISHAPGDGAGVPYRSRQRRRAGVVLLTLGPFAAAVVGGYFYVAGGRFASTENAYVKTDRAAISAEIAGQIARVLVRENERVAKDQPLFELATEPFQIALESAEAQMAKVKRELDVLKESYRLKQQELKMASANLDFAEQTFRRNSELMQRSVLPRSKFDESEHAVTMARQQTEVLKQDLARLLASLGGDVNLPLDRQPAYREARAQRDRAAYDLKRTVVHAPLAGIAARVPERGESVRAGTPVMTVVASDRAWIEANFKETDLSHVEVGQLATIAVDTYGGRRWTGVVESIAQTTGSEFALLPPQNASGNWVKVVQRIPVRIAIQTQPNDPPLRAGMSAEVTIDTGYQRPVPGALAGLINWLREGIDGPAPRRP